MLAIMLTPEQIDVFVELCELVNADTNEKQQAVLQEMAKLGLVMNVTKVNMSKEDYIKHLAKNFGNVVEMVKEI